MVLEILGDPPFERDANGKLKSQIGTIFPKANCLVTQRTIHALQRHIHIDHLNEQRRQAGHPPLTREEESQHWDNAVDLIFEDDRILIRPNPANMHLAFEADDLLQQICPKYKIKFLYALDRQVRDAVKRRGECWRIAALPTSVTQMQEMIVAAKLAISGEEIYYYNKTTGVRWLTCERFAALERLDDNQLRLHLREIQEHSARRNASGYPELDFFQADKSFSSKDLAAHDFEAMDSVALRTVHGELRRKLQNAVPREFHFDDKEAVQWRNRMFNALVAQKDELISEETLLGLSSEFFMQIQWLPGGRIDHGELVFDSTFDLADENPENWELQQLCDERARGFIFNFVREHADLEYVNIGRVENSLSRRQDNERRRGVYLTEVKRVGVPKEIVTIIRMQKWGVREHLDDRKPLRDAMMDSDEYTEYVLDRRLGCRQLGMNLPRHVTAHKVWERYYADWTGPNGIIIWSPYIERDYIRGIATDKVPKHLLENEEYAAALARLLGRAAAVNIIVGRCDRQGKVLFDDGDEVVVENSEGQPQEIVVADPTGTFHNFDHDLSAMARAYAEPVNRRRTLVVNSVEFAQVYIDAFQKRFRRIQGDYRRRRRAFDTLFKYRQRDPNGSFAYRWEQILTRLDRTDAHALTQAIRDNLIL
ncbi:MAG: hypothetical protein ACYC6Y_18510 [Thermoguttaceae bacterium]